MTNNQIEKVLARQLTRDQQQVEITKVANGLSKLVAEETIHLPENYSVSNAIRSAYHILTEVDFGKKSALIDGVTMESVRNSLYDMAIQGLSAVKKQGYFIAYGDKLQFQRSYHGTRAVIKRMKGIKDIWANVIWQGEEFNVIYDRGRLTFDSHKVDWQAATGKKDDILGAYCIIEEDDGTQHLTVMTKAEIEVAWSTSKNRSVQDKYPQEMAKRTVINRASKAFINTSDDSDLLIESVHRTTEDEYEREVKDITPRNVQQEIEQNANQTVIDVQPEQPQQEPQQTQQQVEPVAVEVEQAEQQELLSASNGPAF